MASSGSSTIGIGLRGSPMSRLYSFGSVMFVAETMSVAQGVVSVRGGEEKMKIWEQGSPCMGSCAIKSSYLHVVAPFDRYYPPEPIGYTLKRWERGHGTV